ncbi:MAG: type II toxin-antitoxin system YafQ family toxin [Bacteroidales bacterium]|nr:type II toxin-antitoxin system YafQ family toxin [Bacteroidales bacterium]
MYKIKTSNTFEKDFMRCIKRKYNIEYFEVVINILEKTGKLPPKYKPHKLSGKFKDFWECHVKADWLVIWRQNDNTREIELVRTGTHADLFK